VSSPIRVAPFIAIAIALFGIDAAAQPEAPRVTGGYETTYDRYRYYFENPSTFDSADLVPHNFTQTYWGDNQWLTIAARYQLAHRRWRTEFAITPTRETRGDDVDAFFLTNGDVATSGTSGRIDARSLRVMQEIVTPLGEWTWHGAYVYRRDRHLFHARQLKTVTHTRPPSSASFEIDGAETTISEVHEVRVGISRSWSAGHWKIDARFDASPATYARLTTYLPFKYPGRAIVFAAPVMTLSPAVTFEHGSRWPIAFSVSGLHSFSYSESRQFRRRMWSFSASAGRAF